MALDVKRVSLRWTPEEDSVLVSLYDAYLTPSGYASREFYQKALAAFPHRAYNSIKYRLGVLHKRRGKTIAERRLPPPVLTPAEAAWLAGIFDGEGSISFRDSKSRGKPAHLSVHLVICSNTDEGILTRVQQLIPQARRSRQWRPESEGEQPRWKPCFEVSVFAHYVMYPLLKDVLSYISHSGKKRISLQVLEWLEARKHKWH